MLGQNSITFLILAVIAIVVAAILHYGCRSYVKDDIWSFLSKCVVAWIGAWLGTPVVGAWFAGWNYQHVYFIPAIIGAVGAVIVAVNCARMFAAKSN
jgi:uncharacterized membrane protein YeaQ/YmgE (transglycosylase-associated protein family)